MNFIIKQNIVLLNTIISKNIFSSYLFTKKIIEIFVGLPFFRQVENWFKFTPKSALKESSLTYIHMHVDTRSFFKMCVKGVYNFSFKTDVVQFLLFRYAIKLQADEICIYITVLFFYYLSIGAKW